MPVKERKRPAFNNDTEEVTPLVESKDRADATYFEAEDLREIYSDLSPQQINAARLESTGLIDRSIIASQVSVTPATISSWRKNPKYQQLVNLNIAIIERISREQRVSIAKLVLAPIAAELIKRVNDPKITEFMPIRDLVDIYTKMNKENRLDSTFANDKSEDNDLIDLQKRRNYLAAEQQRQIENLKSDDRIIELPKLVLEDG